MSFVIIVGDGDIDYTDAYGPYDTPESAEQAISETFDGDKSESDVAARTIELRSPESLIAYS